MIQVVLVILVYILGPAVVLVWAVKRFRCGNKPEFSEVVAVSTAVVLIGLIIWAYSGNISDRDTDEVKHIVSTLMQRYQFPVKARFQDRAAVDGIAHARHLEIRIYGVTEPDEQQRINRILEKLRREVASKPLVVRFFKEEVWEHSADGSRRPARDQEQELHKVRIK